MSSHMGSAEPNLPDTELPRRTPATLAEFRDACAGPPGEFLFDVECDGVTVPLRLARARSRLLVILFHGAVDRTKRPYPVFPLARTVPRATVISVADPSMLRHPHLRTAWYLGEESLPVRPALRRLFAEAIDATQATRVVFTGSSVGGFAALGFSWHVPGSVALAFNPQTCVDWYGQSHVDDYRRACWPSLAPSEPLWTVTESDLTRLYGREVPNMVVLAQNATDPHVGCHFAPFVAAIQDADRARLLPLVLPWSLAGHVVPPAPVLGALLKAVLTVPSLTAAEVLTAYMEHAEQARIRRDAAAPPRPAGPEQAQRRDRQLARDLARSASRAPHETRESHRPAAKRGRRQPPREER